MKRLNICKFIFIINLLILPIIILFNINLNDESNIVKEQKNKIQLYSQNSNNIKTIDCTYILKNLGKNPFVNVKSIENEKNNIYVNLNYYGDNDELKKFLKNVSSSKNFKDIKNLSININDKNSDKENHSDYEDDNDAITSNHNESNMEKKQVDITLEYIKNMN